LIEAVGDIFDFIECYCSHRIDAEGGIPVSFFGERWKYFVLDSDDALREDTLHAVFPPLPVKLPFREAAMLESRRQLIQGFAVLTGLAASVPLVAFEQHPPTPQPLPSPNAPNPSFPQGMNGPGPTQPDQKVIDKQNQAQMRADIDKLYALITDLKQEVTVTNSVNVLSVSVMKKAKEIEKLAKQVKDLARG
jgi:hypothetical protein